MASSVDLQNNRLILPTGRSTVVASRLEPRCSYCVFVPQRPHPIAPFQNVLAYVHGHGRRFDFLLNALRRLANRCNYLILCPLFPGSIRGDGNLDGYKYLKEGDVNYGAVLLDMVDQVRSRWPVVEERFLLGGFSGGAQFVHRFYYFYPDKVRAISVAAPSTVSLLTDDFPWWPGIADAAEVMGRTIDFDALKTVDVQLIVGDQDRTFDENAGRISLGSYSMPAESFAGEDRVERLKSLQSTFARRGIASRLDIVPGAGHHFKELLPNIEFFFAGDVAVPDLIDL